jgi:hypothetical protein
MIQVFFADPAKPAWRLFVGKINANVTGLSLVAVRGVDGAPADFNAARFPIAIGSANLSGGGNIREEVEKIRGGRAWN